MIEKVERMGRFTSSNIWKLTTSDRSGKYFGAPAKTYIEEKKAELSLGRSIDLGADSDALRWGRVMEYYAHKFHLDLSYTLCSKETVIHKKYNFWSGSPDAFTSQKACEIKCFEPKKYYLLASALIKLKNKEISIEDFKNDFKEIYWQVVSNSILLNKPICEIIAYMPTYSQLLEIREGWEVDNYISSLGVTLSEHVGVDFQKFHYQINRSDFNLPFIPEHSDFPNFVKFEFQPCADDIIFLTNRAIKASYELS